MYECEEIFAKDDLDIGIYNSEVDHTIDTGDSYPIRQKMRRTPLGFEKEDKEHVLQLLEGIIKPLSSEYVLPPVLVRKNDIKLTYCIDYS
jgi:hypothetical protein